MRDATISRPAAAHPMAEPTDAAGRLARVCPYLVTREGRWRAATPNREHRCGAVSPAALLAPEKQRRLCLSVQHAGCATFAAASKATAGDPLHSTRWAFTRTTPVVLESRLARRRAVGVTDARFGGQLVLVAILAVAFAALALGQLTGGSGVDPGALAPSQPSGVLPPPSSAPATSPPPTATPTRSPSASPSTSASPSAGASATASPATTSYTVQAGDTLDSIARQFNTTVSAIQAANGLGTSTALRVGQVLVVPIPPAGR